MEWKEVEPQQDDWERQIDVVAYYGNHKIGSIILYGDERSWHCVIDGEIEYLEAETEEEAKTEMLDRLELRFEGEIDYYLELTEMLKRLRSKLLDNN